VTELGGRTALKTVLGFDNVDALADKWTRLCEGQICQLES